MVMSTLPSESELIHRVKAANDSAALVTLVNQYSGAYISVVNRYARAYPHVIRQADLADDKLYNIHQFVVAYDPAHETKLSTYIHMRTDYMCKTLLRDGKTNPLMGAGCHTGTSHFDQSEDTFTLGEARITVTDDSRAAQVIEVVNKDVAVGDILDAALRVPDTRFVQILQYRHFASDGETMSWRQIGDRVGLSHEGARQLYNEHIGTVKRYLGEAA